MFVVGCESHCVSVDVWQDFLDCVINDTVAASDHTTPAALSASQVTDCH